MSERGECGRAVKSVMDNVNVMFFRDLIDRYLYIDPPPRVFLLHNAVSIALAVYDSFNFYERDLLL